MTGHLKNWSFTERFRGIGLETDARYLIILTQQGLESGDPFSFAHPPIKTAPIPMLLSVSQRRAALPCSTPTMRQGRDSPGRPQRESGGTRFPLEMGAWGPQSGPTWETAMFLRPLRKKIPKIPSALHLESSVPVREPSRCCSCWPELAIN